MISKIIVHSRTTEINGVCTRIINAYENYNNKRDVHLRSIIIKLKSIASTLSDVVELLNGDSLLEDKDLFRDNAIRDFYYLIQGFLYHPQKNTRNAAGIILDIFNRHGLGIFTKSYGVKTSIINAILMELSKPEFIIYEILLSGVVDAINKIKKTQSDFESSYLNIDKDKLLGFNFESASSLNKKAIKIINGRLVPYLNGMVSVDKENYEEFAKIIDKIIIDNNTKLNLEVKYSTVNEIIFE